MPLNDGVLTILKLVLLAIVYLFFLRVVWAVAAELRAGKRTAPGTPPAPAGATAAAGAGRARTPGRATRVAAPAAAPGARTGARTGARGTVRTLTIIAPPERAGTRVAVTDEMTLGRSAGCNLRIDDTFASSVHARIHRRDGAVIVEDLGSTNGTVVNDRPLTQPMTLRRGDRIRIGRTVLEASR